MTTQLRRVITERDEIPTEEFDFLVEEAEILFNDGEDPEEILHDVFGIEPDYIFDLITELENLK